MPRPLHPRGFAGGGGELGSALPASGTRWDGYSHLCSLISTRKRALLITHRLHPEQSRHPAPSSCTGHHLPAPGVCQGGHGHPGALVHGEAGRSDAVPRLRDRPRRVLLLCLGYGKQLTKQLRVSEPEAWQHLGISQLRAAPGHQPGEAAGAAGGSGAWALPRERPNLGFSRLGLGENLPGLSFPGWDLRFPWGGVPHPWGQHRGFPTVGDGLILHHPGLVPFVPHGLHQDILGVPGQSRGGQGSCPPLLPARHAPSASHAPRPGRSFQ